ncbi:flagellar basal body P-ring protein FlgI [Aquifex aeolicus]|uniref:Flagellar P-ring protein n=1 Tax=Aquifex aeolicus (strain VF5) TaxID=224324 RepID=FLGI_AQUAE|nr:flagellar basal body P-ring protein FlgI [Aquifex aeolicus]O67608.1 RecName: Full=Flagellar P-ring protein; AltName: Full=Basal body P-ring protein; Flags: Precursor [Aquifex aeolicus VF5]AAC07571.1 flagellar P-ring protein FlgI [Aquifex aeolicus VF5]
MACKNIRYIVSLLILVSLTFGARIKDIATIEGNRYNYLIGYGLVVGLKGTGDGKATQFTVQSLANMLRRMGIPVDPRRITVKNVAAVMVTAKVPPYAKAGMRFDVEVSSIGDAKSLEGGTLLMTPLRGPDGKVYAIAQGQVIVGGYEARGRGAAQVKNVPTVGRIPNGAILEKDLPFSADFKEVNIYLDEPDFTTAKNVQDVINRAFGKNIAKAVDSATIRVKIPEGYSPVDFLAKVENLEVSTSSVAKVVIDGRSGIVLLGGNVSIEPVAVAVGSLVVEIKERPEVVQPPPLSPGETKVVPRTEVKVKEEKKRLVQIKGTTVSELVDALNSIGATPREIIQVLQAIKSAGALKAKLEVL